MVWPIIEFTIYIFLSIIIFVLMCTKLCNQRNKLNTKLYEKKLDILHKKFLQYHSKQKQSQQIDQSKQMDEENQQKNPKKKSKELECITHDIGNFKIMDQQLQNVNILKIMRLVKVNGESFKNSKMSDIKLYQKVRWFQLIEYQNIIINKLFSQVKVYEKSKLRLVWFLAQQQIKRKSVFYLILKDEKIGYLHRIASIFIFNIEIAAILVLCQSIRRTFIFSWYNLDSEYQHIKQKITEIQQIKSSCFKLSKGTTNIIISVTILVVAVYQSICMSSEINYNIDYLIALTWLTICVLEVFLFRNFYIIAFNYFLQFINTVSQLQQNIRTILLVYFIIEKIQKKGKARETDDIRRSIMQKINTQQKIQMQKQMTKVKTQKAKSDKQLQKTEKQQTQKPIIEDKEAQDQKQEQNEVDEKNQNEQQKEDIYGDIDDLFNFSSSFFEEDFDVDDDTQKQESQSNNLRESENNNNNNILPQSILNRNTNSINSYKVEQNDDNILEVNQQETTKENHQALDKISQEIVECNTEQNNNIEKKLNTSLAFHDESVIQEEQHVIIDTNTELKQPKNKKNYTYSRILNSSCEIYTVKQLPQIGSNNGNTSDIKSFQTSEAFNQNNYNKNNSNILTFNEFKQNICENMQNKQSVHNDNSLTINREISIGRINNLQVCNIMKLQDQKKYENDVSFLKNLAELKTIKQNNIVSLNKTNNEISIFGQKETSFLVSDEIIQNNQQKNNNSESNILNKSELLEILKPCGLNFQQNA
ncbi:transmembrane protein, putative (macronuclear) [Tetrahymena thermophila SB210]|uniref:Transmembrane protein, putative n=1 Tax=Tetrahymena thermophila (strain SB210) TaxID=312017 RepID=I7M916_TETTS|nr:transmembrane protein, putative [Tetrahymena thermophila SB210]EAS00526.2 transmembrane protein, putative [Tetrahymena thermophila SB210]|eukprot:XP_001020771.2 transmembrane protein, putative [Tetrahymena thermophila SB210]